MEIYASLSVSGDDFDPDPVVAAIGLVPTSAHRKGERRRNGSRYTGTSCWFTTGDRLRDSIDAAFDDLFADLAPAWPYLLSVRDTYTLDLECFVKVYDGDGQPSLAFAARHVAKAAELGTGLGIDYYDFRTPTWGEGRPAQPASPGPH